MTVLEWLRRTFVPLKRTDPRFGRMLFQRLRGDASYWECSGTFAGEQIEYFVTAGEAGPTDAQSALTDELERRWATLEPSLAALLERYETKAREYRVTARLRDWSLGSLSIPAAGDRTETVEIGYVFREGGDLMTFELDPSAGAPRTVIFGE